MSKKKKPTSKVKKTIGTILRSLYSNSVVLDSSKEKGWYWAVIFFFLATVVAAIPTMVNYLGTTGSDFITESVSYTYGFDYATIGFVESINENEVEMLVTTESDGTKYLYVDETKWNETYLVDTLYDGTLDVRYTHLNSDGEIDLDVYYTSSTGTAFSTFVSDVASNYIPGTTTYNNSSSSARDNSFIVFGRYQYIVYLYQKGSTSYLSYTSGNYNNFESGYSLKNLILVYDEDGNLVSKESEGVAYQTYLSGVFTNLQEFFNTGYLDIRNTTTWQMTLIIFGINVFVVAFLGLIVFLFTRGRNNIYRTITFWQSQKIVYWASFSPGLLTLIFGFIFSTLSYIYFPLLISLRVMWLVTKNLRPERTSSQPTAKELAAYEAREKARQEALNKKKNKNVIDAEFTDKKASKNDNKVEQNKVNKTVVETPTPNEQNAEPIVEEVTQNVDTTEVPSEATDSNNENNE